MAQSLSGIKTSLVWRVTGLLVILVGLSIAVMAGLGYWKLYQVTEENAAIRIDRAARAAGSIFSQFGQGQFETVRDQQGHPISIRFDASQPGPALESDPLYDTLLNEIGDINQGAANLFKYNSATNAFDRFSTTFRKPDGTMPPPMSLGEGHPAFANLISLSIHVGEVPVMGRMRLAYLTPILTMSGEIAGALAVDVGWVDDLIVARENLQGLLFGSAAVLLLIVVSVGVAALQNEMYPLRKMAAFANIFASGKGAGKVPYLNRTDEVGALAHGLYRVVGIQDELEHLAYTDLLTNCGNRTRYIADLERSMQQAISGQLRPAILHLDIKRFGKINNSHGQNVGDQVLVHVANILKGKFGQSARVYRITADQFCLIVGNFEDWDALKAKCLYVINCIQNPLVLSTCELTLDCRMGAVKLPKDATDVETALRNAGLALSGAKQQENEKFVFFAPEQDRAAQRQTNLETMLREALARKQLSLNYQPQVCANSLDLFGLEALVRWQHPVEGFISPGEFIPVAEKTGLIIELGNYVLNESCRQIRQWINQGVDFKKVSVNVSPIQLWQQNFVQTVEDCLKTHGIDGKHLCLELTESVFIEDGEKSIAEIMQSLRKHNISFSLDDFGSGYSSLGYLNRLPFDQLKIDRYFVSDADSDASKAKLLTGMIGLGNGLGLTVVAEGAETVGEYDLLRSISSDIIIQGYLFSKPVSASRLPYALGQIGNVLVAPHGERRIS